MRTENTELHLFTSILHIFYSFGHIHILYVQIFSKIGATVMHILFYIFQRMNIKFYIKKNGLTR